MTPPVQVTTTRIGPCAASIVRRTLRLLLIVTLAAAVSMRQDAAAQTEPSYEFVEIAPGFAPQGVSDSGVVVGYYGTAGYTWTRSGGLVPISITSPAGAIFPVYSGSLFFNPARLAINGAGDVIVGLGGYADDNGIYVEEPAAVSSTGQLTFLGRFVNGSGGGGATAINNIGQIVGFEWGGGYNNYGPFIWSGSTGLQQLSGYEAGSSYDKNGIAFDVNNIGEVVGTCGGGRCFAEPTHYNAAFFWSPTSGFVVLPFFPGSTEDIAHAVNDAGVVVGHANIYDAATAVSNFRMFRWSAATALEDLNAPAGYPQFLDINNAGDIVATIATASGPVPYLYRNGTWMNLNALLPADSDFVLQTVRAIGAEGHIVGVGSQAATPGQSRGFILVPSTVTDPDVTPPALELPGAIVVNGTSPAGAVVIYTVGAVDDIDPDPTVSCDWASGSTFPLGGSTVHCTATDASGNAQAGSFSILVKDALAQVNDLYGLVLSWSSVLSKSTFNAISGKVQKLRQAIEGTGCATSPGGGGGRACPLPCPSVQELIKEIQKQASRLTPQQYTQLLSDATRIKNVLGCSF